MLTIIHGDNITESRAELERLKKSALGRDIRQVNGKAATETEIVQALESQSLFGGETAVIFEQLMSRFQRKNKEAEALAKKITAACVSTDVVIWEAKEIAPSLLNLFTGAKPANRLFKTPAAIFAYLDGFRPDNPAQLLTLYRKTGEKDAPELIFSLLSRRVRQLVLAKDHALPPTVTGWQASRLTSQAQAFTMEKLLDCYREIREYEFAWKTGRTPVPVVDFLAVFSATL